MGATAAVLNGTLNANGGYTAVSFDYGLTTSYGTTVAGTPATVTGSTGTAVSAAVTGLLPATTYHYRVNATSGGVVVSGADMTFTTPNATLSGLAISTGTLSPTFSSTVYSYAASVGTAVSSVTLTPTTADVNATVKVNGVATTSGTASSPVSLVYGDNTISVVVTAADHVSTLAYTVIVTRAVSNPLTAAFTSSSTIPVTISAFTATGSTVNLSLGYAPTPGTTLTVVKNTGLGFINGTFSNLSQGQMVSLSYNSVTYQFVASYFGGTGNDLVLTWAPTRLNSWGLNGNGQLGNGTTTNSSVPQSVAVTGSPLSGRAVLTLAAGYAHSLALCSDGTLASWGYNIYGQLGNNTTTDSSVPVAVTTTGTPLAGKTVVAVSGGYYHTLALCSDGTVAAWGYGYNGELGNGTTTQSNLAVAVTTTGTALAGKTVVAVSAGSNHNLALCSDGTIATWGYNTDGQLGNNTTTSSSVPVAVTTAGTALAGKTVIAVAAGASHSMALCSDGTIAAWGYNYNGQLGNNTTINSSVPVAVTTVGTALAGKTAIAVAAGTAHSMALCSDGTISSWGDNLYGELGNSSNTQSNVPVAVTTSGTALSGKSAVSIAACYNFSTATCSDGTVAAWGYNYDGELGNNGTGTSNVAVAVSTSTLGSAEKFMLATSSSNSYHTLGLVATQVPAATTLAASSLGATTAVMNGSVNANGSYSTVSFDYGLTTSYGTNVAGTPALLTSTTGTAVSAALTGLLPATTYHYRVNATNAGTVVSGSDMTFTTPNATLSGLALSTGSLSPTFSPAVYSYTASVANTVTSVSVTPTTADVNATVTVNGTATTSGSASSPVSLSYGDNTISIVVTAADHVSTLAYSIIVTRAVPNPFNVSYSSSSYVPVNISAFTATGSTVNLSLNYAPVAGTTLTIINNTGLGFINGAFSNLSQGQSVNLSYNGATYKFVANYYGGTGNDLVLMYATSRPVAWGYNNYGELGNNTTTSSSVPVSVTTTGTSLANRTLLALTTGYAHSLALCSDGTLSSWGYNTFGQLGNNTTTNSSVPIAVPTTGTPLAGKTPVAIYAGYGHCLVLCSDGTLASWGYNTFGQLGNNTTTNSSVPIAVTTTGTPLAGKTVVAASAGYYHSLALCSDGTVATWGYGYDGELGNGTTTVSYLPVAVTTAGTALAGKTVVAVSAGQYHNMALCSDGTIATWGYNFYGGLGNGTTTSSSLPVAVTTAGTALAGKTVVSIAAGQYHSMALCSDGTIATWGYNNYGQLGNNTTTNSSVPVAVTTTGTALAGKTVIAVRSGAYQCVALCSDGTLASWGYNTDGELGNNSTAQSSVAVAVSTSTLATGEKFMLMSGGSSSYHTQALVAAPQPSAITLAASSVTGSTAVLNGTVNANGGSASVTFDYGLDTSYGTNVAGTPATVTGSTSTAVSLALTGLPPGVTYHYRVNAVTSSGTANGADMTFTTPNYYLSALVPGTGSLSPSFSSTVFNYNVAVGTSVTSATITPTTSDANATMTVNGVSLTSGGTSSPLALAYGDNFFNIVVTAADRVSTQAYTVVVTRALPNPFNVSYSSGSTIPVNISSLNATGNSVNLSLNYAPVPGTTLTVVNNTGLGFISGTFSNLTQGQAVNLSYNGVTYKFVANYYGGTGNDLVLMYAASRPVAWGYNVYGELGNNSTTNSLVPASVTTTSTPLAGRTLLALTTGYAHSLALCSDGTLSSWGYNTYGQLGNGTTTNSSVPIAMTITGTPLAGKTPIAIAAGYGHSLALCSDGSLATWGYNNYGQLGNNTTANSSVPVAVTTTGTPLAGKTVVSAAAGGSHNLVLCSDGSLATWGYNTYGQLGNGTLANSSVPVAVTTAGTVLAGKTVVAVAAGYSHSMALCSDGTIATWGYNTNGQLGNNSTANSNIPVAVTTAGTALAGKTVVAVAAGQSHSMALCSDGTVATWGYNTDGELGNNSTTQSNVAVAVTTTGTALAGKTVIAVRAGRAHSMAFCSDGTLASWGYNADGELGTNNTTQSNVAVAVSTSTLVAGEKFMLMTGGSYAYHTEALVAASPPAATPLAATSVTTSSAVLNGTVNAYGSSASVTFDYGLDTSYGTNVAASPATVTGSTNTAVSLALTGLQPGTTYHYRVNAVSSVGSTSSADMTFATPNCYLSALAPGTGSLSPAFSSTVYSYAVAVDGSVSSFSLTPTTADSGATVTVNGVSVTSGSASSPIALGYGNNAINIVVTASDHVSTLAYTVVVTRAIPNPLTASYSSSSDVPLTVGGLTITSGTVNLALNYAPTVGTTLTVVKNTGLGFISGTFSNLSQGQAVNLSYNGVTYKFVANYYGGTGNDLVLMYAASRPVAWGYNPAGELGNNTTSNSSVPVSVTTAATPLAGHVLLALSAGYEHSLALCSDGTLSAWGLNANGQLGNGTTNNNYIPAAVTTASTPLAGKSPAAVSAGYGHNLVLCTDGSVSTWGLNAYGQLGNNTTTNSLLPVAVITTGTPLAGKTVVAVVAGGHHSLALCSDGTLVSWGYNTYGQLGNNTTTNSSVPVAVTTSGTALAGKTVIAIAAGFTHSLALCSDGTIATWGYNNFGQLGNNTLTSSSVPVAVTTSGTALAGKTVTALAAGQSHSMALCSDGSIATWGYNTSGQLGNNTTTNSSVPVAVTTTGTALAGKTPVAVSAGVNQSMAVCSDGSAATWGYNSNGQLGNNSTTSSSVPVAVSTSTLVTGEKFMLLSTGSYAYHSVALVAAPPAAATTLAATSVTGGAAVLNGSVNASGGSASVSFDYGLDTSYGTNVAGTPATVTGSTSTAVSLALSGLQPGVTYHYRVNAVGTTGTTNGADMTFSTPNNYLSSLVPGSGSLSPAFSSAVFSYALAVTSDVASISFTPTTSDASATMTINGAAASSGTASTPVSLAYGDNTISIVVTAADHVSTQAYTVVVTRALPNPFNVSYSSGSTIPVSISSLNATGNSVNLSLNYAPVPGTTLMVVNNTGPGFISGTFSNLSQGQAVNLSYNGVNYKFVANYYGGTGNDLVLMWSPTRPVSWGYNPYGELGNNSTTTSSLPVSVTTTATPLASRALLAIAGGYEHSLALCTDGTLVSWGYNVFGQLGNGTTSNSNIPVAVTIAGTPLVGKTPALISAGYEHNLALCTDGTLVSWGYNINGQLGNGTTTNSNVPVAVTTTGTPLAGRTVVSLAAGGSHTLALCSDGTLAAWGSNNYGQLGNGTTTNSNVPVAVSTTGTALAGKTIIAIAAGTSHSMALCSDGTVASWGYNSSGQLGNNSTVNSNVAVAVVTTGVLSGKTVVALSAGYSFSVARCSDGTVASWGYNTNGQLGNGSTTQSNVPVAVSTSTLTAGEKLMQLGLGQSAYHSLALVAMPPAPSASTLAATSITVTTATLNGTANANGGSATVSFDYGLDTSYGTNVAGSPATVTGSTGTAVSVALTGLTPATTYHYRVNTADASGNTHGSDMTFTTLDTNASLSAITITPGALTPAFDSNTLTYAVGLPNAATSFTVAATTASSAATLTMNGTAQTSGTTSAPNAFSTNSATVTLVVTAQDGTTSKTYTLNLTRNTLYLDWAASNGLNSTNNSATADADGDGIPNLLEYAFNSSPTTQDRSVLPATTTSLNPADGKHYFTYAFRQLINPGTLTYGIETSPDLITWTAVPAQNLQQVGTAVPTGDGVTQVVTFRILPSIEDSPAASFVRLKVTP